VALATGAVGSLFAAGAFAADGSLALSSRPGLLSCLQPAAKNIPDAATAATHRIPCMAHGITRLMHPRPATAVRGLGAALLVGATLALPACGCTDGGVVDAFDAAPATFDAARSAADAASPTYAPTIEPIPASVRADMIGRSWHRELACPGLDDLRLITLPYWGFDGHLATGELIVAASVADDVAAAFGDLYAARFPIAHMIRIDAYGGDDDASTEDNNTSAFNCRAVTGGSSLSQHSFGTAIDINPVQNPYLSGDRVLPDSGHEYLDRARFRPGMIVRPGQVVDAFERIGWHWGGDWTDPIDYQHVSQSGR